MDLAKWWNTKGQLGRGRPSCDGDSRERTRLHRRDQYLRLRLNGGGIFDPPESVTLWRLPQSIEEEFDARWEHWLEHRKEWEGFFE